MKKSVTILGREYYIETTIAMDLSYKGLTEIPKAVNELVNLERLYLKNNEITSMENINNLKNLKLLDLGFNCIERIEGLDNLNSLRSVWLDKNKIEIIENIHHLDNLKKLYIRSSIYSEDIEEARKISLINERAKKLERI